MSAPRIWGAQVATASSNDSDYCPGPTRQASGVTLMNTPTAAREKAWQTFERMAKLDTQAALRLGAEKGPFDKVPCLRFEEAAHEDFLGWRTDVERRLRSCEMSPALEGHLAKYRKLVPSLALINHLADGGTGPISKSLSENIRRDYKVFGA